MTLVCNALLFPVESEVADPYSGWILTDGKGRIAAVGPSDAIATVRARAEEVVDLDGAFVIPGLVSAHSHLWQSAFRGIADGASTFGWIDGLHKRIGSLLSDDDLHAFTAHGHADLLSHGITTVCNHTHDFGQGYRGQWRAARESVQHVEYSFSTPRWATARERMSLIDEFARETRDERDRMLGVSVNTTGALTREEMRAEADRLRELGFAQHAHFLEDPAATADQQASWPDLVASGRIDPHTVLAHFIHTTAQIRADAAELGAAMVWNPLSNGRLGSGIPDIVGYLGEGIRVGMGVDGQASADVADPFQNMRTGLYLLRANAGDPSVMSARRMLRLHTLDSAAAIGVEAEVGSLEPGKRADFVVLSARHPFANLDSRDAWAFVVLSLSAHDITDVYVDGERVSSGPGDMDSALLDDCRERLHALRARRDASERATSGKEPHE